ncbi:MAG: YkvA family protein [Methylophilaceae bacterium]
MGMLKEAVSRLKTELAVYQKVLKHPQTPYFPKILLGLAVAYVLMPFDLIPDFIPVLGQLDELVIIPVLVIVAIKFIPQHIMLECRQQVANESEHV